MDRNSKLTVQNLGCREASSQLFPPVTVNNSKQATEVEQLYLQLELINIEEQMLKLQMLKQAT